MAEKYTSKVSRIEAAPPEVSAAHFASLLAFETDCSDVNHVIANNKRDFILLDVRSEELFEKGHVPNAICIPNWKINQESLASYPDDSLFVVYCAGPHCNGADKAALAIAKCGRRVKKMIGGVTGWLDEGLELEK